MIEFLLTTIHILVSLFLILVVLLQQGKGADLSVFGGGGTQTAFGARGAATILHKMTVFGFISFVLTTILIGVFVGGTGGSSVMEDLSGEAAVVAPVDVDSEDSGAPAIGVGVDSSSPDIEVEAEPLTDAAEAVEDAADEVQGAVENSGGTGGQ